MDFVLKIILMLPAVLIGFTFHEFAHAKMADRLGDKTARFQGRLNLNPFNHVDPIGALMLLTVGFGWAKPVETNPSAYKNYYKDDLKVSIAGPLANLVIAVLGCLAYFTFLIYGNNIIPDNYYNVISNMLFYIYFLNLNLFVFNMLPLPGLDGFHILRDLFPKQVNEIYNVLMRYQLVILILVLAVGGWIIKIPRDFFDNIILNIVRFILGF